MLKAKIERIDFFLQSFTPAGSMIAVMQRSIGTRLCSSKNRAAGQGCAVGCKP